MINKYESDIQKGLERLEATAKARAIAHDRMMSAIKSVNAIPDEAPDAKHADTLFKAADEIDEYVKYETEICSVMEAIGKRARTEAQSLMAA